MAVKLRLRRMGRKKQPFYRIVAVDSREKRDGRYLDNVGTYNPLPDPFELQVNVDRALYWLNNGAQPSDTVRSLFRRVGVMLRFDLMRRGSSEEVIAARLKEWEAAQQEKLKRLEAEKIQKQRKAKSTEEPAAQAKPERAETEAETPSQGAGTEPETDEKPEPAVAEPKKSGSKAKAAAKAKTASEDVESAAGGENAPVKTKGAGAKAEPVEPKAAQPDAPESGASKPETAASEAKATSLEEGDSAEAATSEQPSAKDDVAAG